MIEISFSASSPIESAYITNIVAEEFKILNAETSQGEVSDLRDFLERQVAKKETELSVAEEKLREYQEEKKPSVNLTKNRLTRERDRTDIFRMSLEPGKNFVFSFGEISANVNPSFFVMDIRVKSIPTAVFSSSDDIGFTHDGSA